MTETAIRDARPMPSTLAELPEPVREMLCAFSAYTKLGYASEQVRIGPHLIRGRPCICTAAVLTHGARKFVLYFDAPEFTTADLSDVVMHALGLWNAASMEARTAMYEGSWVQANAVEIVARMVAKGFPPRGPLAGVLDPLTFPAP